MLFAVQMKCTCVIINVHGCMYGDQCLLWWFIVQINLPTLQSRCYHSAGAFSLSPGLTEVTIFGGCPEFPNNYMSDADLPRMANTTVLRFGEYT